jgi:hypothetical protein
MVQAVESLSSKCISPEFKPQFHQKIERKKNREEKSIMQIFSLMLKMDNIFSSNIANIHCLCIQLKVALNQEKHVKDYVIFLFVAIIKKKNKW